MPAPPKFAFLRFCQDFWQNEDGASLVEYVLLVALIAVVAVAAITLLGTNTNAKLTTAAGALQ